MSREAFGNLKSQYFGRNHLLNKEETNAGQHFIVKGKQLKRTTQIYNRGEKLKEFS